MCRNPRGFSLLEVFFAMTLFAAVGAAVNLIAIKSVRHTLRNYHGTYAAVLAQNQVESLENANYVEIESGRTTTTINGLAYTVDTHVDATPTTRTKQVTVTVSWTGLEGYDSYVVQTVLTQLS
jgi:Tfp pilus assembly protein PilV